ncbi:conserved hypothetical protein [Nitrobacter hamburgensis X14]|uniref:Uncharacterized protein n=1 Tax=Nitrobacter hamburgensis (strain DSM 10229 / NCIMB 13809 / X14) TaxID=323097 RepID=Q1QQK5_NITHX|nr:hypothetical protein [Nitrobacter hamburgensis]ABE61492.1 conserved hypothetical protein [Nitrobacter hamburgensis X14]
MSSIEPLAREVCELVCRQNGMAEADIPAWVDSHWEAAAAEIEAGNCDDNGEIIPGPDWQKGAEAYRERMAAKHKPK